MTDKSPITSNSVGFFNYLFYRKRSILIWFAAASVLFFYSASGIKLREDIMDLLPTEDPVVKKYKTLLTGFKGLDYMLIDVGPEEGQEEVSQEELVAVADSLVERISSSKSNFKEVHYKWDAGDISSAIDMLREHRASLFTEEDKKGLEERLKIESIRETLGGWKKLLTESPAPFLSQSFSRDPLAMDLMLMNRLKSFNIMGSSVRMEGGRIFSQDFRHILILAMPQYPGSDNFHAQALISFMDKATHESEAKVPAGKIHVAYMGSHRFGLDNSEMIKGDIQKTMTISLVSISLLSILVYRRTVLLTILTLVPAFFGGIFASGMIRLLYPTMSAISVGCGSMLVGIVVDYGIYFLYQFDQLSDEEVSRHRLVEILDRIFLPVLMCAGTTIIAFMAMQISAMPGVRQLGLFAAFGVAGAAFFTLTALPLLIPKNTRLRKKMPIVSLANLYPPYFRWVERSRRFLFVVLGLLSIASAAGLYRLEFEGDIQKLNAASRETRRDWEIVIKSFGDVMNSTSAAVTAPTVDEALEKNDRLYPEILRLQETGLVNNNNSISSIFPGKAKQQENRLRWEAFWSNERVGRLLKDVERVSLELRINPAALTNVLRDLPGAMPELKMDDFKTSFLNNIISNQISANPGQAFVLTNLTIRRDEDFVPVMNSLEKADPESLVTNGKYFVQHTVHLIYRELFVLGGAALFFIAVLLAVYVKRLDGFLTLFIPVLLSLLWTLGFMGWLGIKINILNSIVVLLIFGLGIDYIVFIDSGWKSAHSEKDVYLTRTSGAVTVSALSTILGMGALLFAKHPALHAIGASTVLAISIGMIAALVVVPLISKRATD